MVEGVVVVVGIKVMWAIIGGEIGEGLSSPKSKDSYYYPSCHLLYNYKTLVH